MDTLNCGDIPCSDSLPSVNGECEASMQKHIPRVGRGLPVAGGAGGEQGGGTEPRAWETGWAGRTLGIPGPGLGPRVLMDAAAGLGGQLWDAA